METEKTEKNAKNFWRELIKLIILSLVIVLPFRLYIAQPFIVEGASMDPTFENGQYLIVDELSYRFKSPERGSVVVFHYPRDPKKPFIKRIIGLPNETISINLGKVTIKNSENPQGFVIEEPYIKLNNDASADYTIGDDEYFVMGDNRINSADSRAWGPLPRENIIGRPIIRFLPLDLFPGDHSEDKDEYHAERY